MTSPVELLHPDGGMGLMFNVGAPLWRDGVRHVGPGWVDGPSLRSARLGVEAGLDLLGVRFLPGMGGAVLGEAPEALAEAGLMPAEALRRRSLVELHERLAAVVGFEARIALLERHLLAGLNEVEAPPPLLGGALAWLQQRQGQGSIAELAEALSVSQRRLQRLFRGHLGLSPKQYARALRVAHGRALIKRAAGPGTLVEVAHDAGYFDQAHFVHDFTAMTGLTPSEYRRHVQWREGERGTVAPLGSTQP
ncbi:helix-turn-helix domain-containing protein [Halomonas ramblicola]|nr:helix-turn-helix domain-containing protein [Halomonas ramblicola]MDN3523548.1 helix-turn-helix domain-containing protein [Halomonas ramblicola]